MPVADKIDARARAAEEARRLYDADLFAWTVDQARRLRSVRPADLDWENLAEEIESLGRSQKSEIRSRMVKLLSHLLKWEIQPTLRCNSWLSTIGEQRTHIDGLVETSPSLRRYPAEAMDRAWRHARREAAVQTRRPEADLPAECPWPVEAVLDPAFFPGPPWHPADLGRE